jgi:CheY-like chemotaxis protein
MDLQMPRTDGIELLRDLALNKCTAEILLTSGLDLRMLDTARHLGAERGLKMQGILQKPIPIEELEALMARQRPADDVSLADQLGYAIGADELFLE